ncbi:hypothetical protein LNKW23_37590 [Paralimibaculum aggregatum]|uniref:Uncharacterized protein n=1 Tax=Paralimibaculum aggregatum TaxID=3036245 RepID=A0ABQ6LMY1_9RHOB|nr:hypothetical protein [Limibaculum sp. NKW23]GMG84543.1 hypothetical protein LNKW23_37590 [Limibaculum sp. NKW23]
MTAPNATTPIGRPDATPVLVNPGMTWAPVRAALPALGVAALPYLIVPGAARSFLTVSALEAFDTGGHRMLRLSLTGGRSEGTSEHVVAAHEVHSVVVEDGGSLEACHSVLTRVVIAGRAHVVELVLLERPGRTGLLHLGRNAQRVRPAAWSH